MSCLIAKCKREERIGRFNTRPVFSIPLRPGLYSRRAMSWAEAVPGRRWVSWPRATPSASGGSSISSKDRLPFGKLRACGAWETSARLLSEAPPARTTFSVEHYYFAAVNLSLVISHADTQIKGLDDYVQKSILFLSSNFRFSCLQSYDIPVW